MCSGSETSSYVRPIDSVYHSTLGLRVNKKKVEERFFVEALTSDRKLKALREGLK